MEGAFKMINKFDAIYKLVQAIKCVYEIVKDFFANFKKAPKKKTIILVVVGAIILCSVLGVIFIGYDSNMDILEDTYPEYKVHISPDNTECYDNSTSNALVFDVESFYLKYYKDTFCKQYLFMIGEGINIEDVCEKFIELNDFEFSRNIDIDITGMEVKNLLKKAIQIEKSGSNNIANREQIASLREQAYTLCNNNIIARLTGNDYYNLFFLATGEKEKLRYATLSLQYYIRSILLSSNNRKNISYCSMAISIIYANLAKKENNSNLKTMLYYEALLYMKLSKAYHTIELHFSYYDTSNYLAIIYYNLLVQNKVITNNTTCLDYLRVEAYSNCKEALSDISTITPEDEVRYRKTSDLLDKLNDE